VIRGPYDDFTEASYLQLLVDVANNYEFGTFYAPPQGPHVLWRHDIDLSPQRAHALARIEAEGNIRATYFVRVRSPFYNVFERPITALLKEIARDHQMGLHVEPVSASYDDVYGAVEQDRQLLEEAIERPVQTVSFHNPTVMGLLKYDMPKVSGLVNAISKRFISEYKYVSDSGGSWREPIHELLDPRVHPRLHVATHPEWWTPIAMSPNARIHRGLNGRRAASWNVYVDEITARFGVVNDG
jgi:hypothetical protein